MTAHYVAQYNIPQTEIEIIIYHKFLLGESLSSSSHVPTSNREIFSGTCMWNICKTCGESSQITGEPLVIMSVHDLESNMKE